MGILTATVDTSRLEQALARLQTAIETESVSTVADVHKHKIQGLTAQGADAFGEIFHAYSASHAKVREAAGYETEVKDLRMGEGRLMNLELSDNVLSYADEKTQLIALGQMAHPKWSYHHRFLDVSEETNNEAAEDLAAILQRVIA